MTEPVSDRELSAAMLEALNRLVHLTSGTATHQDAEDLRQWRAAKPAHEAAFRKAVYLRRLVRQADFPPDEESASPLAHVSAMPSRRMVLTGGLAASLAVWLGARPPFDLWPSFAELSAGHRTGAGQRVQLTPASGIAVELNARSALSFADAGRRMTLIAGEAFVTVLNGQPAPFRIVAGSETVAVDAGSLDIRTSARETCITCVTGSARRDEAGAETLRAGQQLVSTAAGHRIATVDPEMAIAWRQGMLIFRDTPLAEVIEAVNRYYDGRIILTDAALGDRRMSGLFRTDRIGAVVDQLELVLNKRATHLPGGVTVLG